MKKRKLLLDKEIVTASNARPTIEGGTTACTLLLAGIEEIMLSPQSWESCNGPGTCGTCGTCPPPPEQSNPVGGDWCTEPKRRYDP